MSVTEAEVDVDGFVDEVGFLGAVAPVAAGGVGELVSYSVDVDVVGVVAEGVADALKFGDDVAVILAELFDAPVKAGAVDGDVRKQAGVVRVGAGLGAERVEKEFDAVRHVREPCLVSAGRRRGERVLKVVKGVEEVLRSCRDSAAACV